MTDAELLADLRAHGLNADGTLNDGYRADLSDLDPALPRRARRLLRESRNDPQHSAARPPQARPPAEATR